MRALLRCQNIRSHGLADELRKHCLSIWHNRLEFCCHWTPRWMTRKSKQDNHTSSILPSTPILSSSPTVPSSPLPPHRYPSPYPPPGSQYPSPVPSAPQLCPTPVQRPRWLYPALRQSRIQRPPWLSVRVLELCRGL